MRLIIALLVMGAVSVSAETPWTLKMHESTQIFVPLLGERQSHLIEILRVPGGWIYDGKVFVPWVEEKPAIADTWEYFSQPIPVSNDVKVSEINFKTGEPLPLKPNTIKESSTRSAEPDTVRKTIYTPSELDAIKKVPLDQCTGHLYHYIRRYDRHISYRCIFCGKLKQVPCPEPNIWMFTEKELEK